ncbi:MAG: hypothetical protein R3282_01175, partial [Rhodothermales bacterium]|nr:hypothetical protein [Rhodothermales bacterium]
MRKAEVAFADRAWETAYHAFVNADRANALGALHLEAMATSAYLAGREDAFLKTLERAHHLYLERDDRPSAARCAFWIGLTRMLVGDQGPAAGWLGRAARVIEGCDCVEQGYLLLPLVEQQIGEGSLDAACETSRKAGSIGDDFEDRDLVACARHLHGRALVLKGQFAEGVALLDEAMVAAASGELSPIVTGLVYCSVIEACQRAFALARAREWTKELSAWCDQQPEMFAFTV